MGRSYSVRRSAGAVFAQLRAEGEEQAAAQFLRLCALCLLEVRGWLPQPQAPCWQMLWQPGRPGHPAALRAARSLLAQALPRLFSENDPLPPARWFDTGGPAARLRLLCRQLPAGELPGLTGRLWEGCAEAPRRESFAVLRQNQPHTGRGAAYATQLFTPGWLARFLLENAAGRLLGEQKGMDYFLACPGRQEESLSPAVAAMELTVLDPCAGGGELLCRAFDLLLPRLTAAGISPGDAAQHLLEHSLHGLDTDRGALGACYLELMLRGRACDPRFWERKVVPRLAAVEYRDGAYCREGSLLAEGMAGFARLAPGAAELLCRQYDIVAANPPYMGLKGMSPELRGFLRSEYPDGRSDLYAAFALRCAALTRPGGCTALLMPQGWLSLASFAGLRSFFARYDLPVLLRLGAHAFPDLPGEVVQTAAFVARMVPPGGATALCDLCGCDTPEAKQAAFLSGRGRSLLTHPLEDQPLPPGCRPLARAARLCQGLATGDNNRFVRLWWEVDPRSIARGCADRAQAAASGKRWFPYHKGGGFRRWWGNDLYVVDFAEDGREIRAQRTPAGRPRARVQNAEYYFRPGVTWSFVGSKNFSARLAPAGFIFDVGGSTAFPLDGDCLTLAALLNSAPARQWLLQRNPTVNFQVGDLAALPCPELGPCRNQITALAGRCAALSRRRWEQQEPAPAFVRHPWAQPGCQTLREAALLWQRRCQQEDLELYRAQRSLDELFAPLLRTGPGPAEPTPQPPDLAEECRRFLSWCVGAAVGRFGAQTHRPGPAADCLGLDDGPEGLAGRVRRLLAGLWGEQQLEGCLTFLAQTMGWRGQPAAALEEYLRGDFFIHHARLYHNRPIYWRCCPEGRQPALLYYHALNAATPQRLAALWRCPMTPALKQAGLLWAERDLSRGILPHLQEAAALGLACPPGLPGRKSRRAAP